MTQPISRSQSPVGPVLKSSQRIGVGSQETPQAPQVKADFLSLQHETPAASSWIDAATQQIPHADAAALSRLADEAMAKAHLPGSTPTQQASCYFVASQAYGRLSNDLKVDENSNGEKAFHAIVKAVQLDPSRPDIVQGYGEAIKALVDLNGFERAFAEDFLGVDTLQEAKHAVKLLDKLPPDAKAASTQKALSAFIQSQE